MKIIYDNDAEKHNFGKILGIAAAVIPEDKNVQALIEKIVAEDTETENTEDCEYDIDNNECLATGCNRYRKCTFTNTIK